MIVTMLEARVPDENSEVLAENFAKGTDSLPPPILQTFLLRDVGSDLWRIVTVWASREDLNEYRASVETPEGVLMFRAAGAEPTLSVFDVASHASQS